MLKEPLMNDCKQLEKEKLDQFLIMIDSRKKEAEENPNILIPLKN